VTTDAGARRTALVILALLFALTIVLAALVPLLPRFVDEFGISTVQAGALFSVVTLVMVVGSVPAGMLADRVGPRAVVVAAIGFLLASCLLQGLASGYWMLFVGRALFVIAHTGSGAPPSRGSPTWSSRRGCARWPSAAR
jgi:predicted MFS family arabinose efflux permease